MKSFDKRYFSASTKKLHTLLRWGVTLTFLSLQVGQRRLQLLHSLLKSFCEVFVLINFNGKSYTYFVV